MELKIAKHREEQAPERLALKRRLEGELGLRVIIEVEEEEKNSSSLSISNSEKSVSEVVSAKEKKEEVAANEVEATKKTPAPPFSLFDSSESIS